MLFIDKMEDISVGMQRQPSTIQAAQQTVEVPQVRDVPEARALLSESPEIRRGW